MRKFITPSCESQSFANLGVLSIEEEEMIAAELPAEEVTIQQEIQEANNALEISDALEDLALIADSIPEASNTDVQLLETAVSVAAGPEIEVEEIVPALESYVGRRISTEGLVEMARSIWENIKAWLNKMWKKVKDFFYKIFGQIPGLRRKVEAMKKRVEDTGGYKKEESSVSISSGVKFMSINGSAVKNISGFNDGLAKWQAIAEGISNISSEAEKFSTKAAEMIAEFDVKNVGQVNLATFVQSINTTKLGNSSKPSTVEDNYNSSEFTVTYSESLLGNVVYQYVEPVPKSTNLLGTLEKIRRTRINPCSTVGKNKDADTSVDFTTAGLGDLTKSLELCEKILDGIEKARRGSGVEKAEKARDKLKQACEKAEGSYKKASSDKDLDNADGKHSLAVFKSLLSLNLTASNLFIAPTASISSNSLSVVRATLALTAKNLTAYKKA